VFFSCIALFLFLILFQFLSCVIIFFISKDTYLFDIICSLMSDVSIEKKMFTICLVLKVIIDWICQVIYFLKYYT